MNAPDHRTSENGVPRIQTGYFVRAERGGKWQSIDIIELTEPEIEKLFESNPQKAVQFVIALVGWINDHVRFEP